MERQRLIVLRGIPASGKSTWAMKYVTTHDNSIIINRDSLRKMCGKYWVPSREELISAMEKLFVKTALEMGFTVIVDATNLKQEAIDIWRSFIKEDSDISFEVKTFIIPKWKAYWRDWKRGLFGGHKVGRKVIGNFYTQMQEIEIH